MCMCVCVHMHADMCRCKNTCGLMHVEARSHYFETKSLLNLELSGLASWMASKLQGCIYLCLPRAERT